MWESVGLYKCITLDTNLSPNIQISTEPVFWTAVIVVLPPYKVSVISGTE